MADLPLDPSGRSCRVRGGQLCEDAHGPQRRGGLALLRELPPLVSLVDRVVLKHSGRKRTQRNLQVSKNRENAVELDANRHGKSEDLIAWIGRRHMES